MHPSDLSKSNSWPQNISWTVSSNTHTKQIVLFLAAEPESDFPQLLRTFATLEIACGRTSTPNSELCIRLRSSRALEYGLGCVIAKWMERR